MQDIKNGEISSKIASPKFSSKKEKAIILLLEGAKVCDVAVKVGVSERTIQRWLKGPEFQKRLREARAETYKRAIDAIQKASTKAAAKVIELLDSPSEKIALKAAEHIINISRQCDEQQEIEKRIEELESIVLKIKGGTFYEFEEASREIRKNIDAR